MQGDEFVDDRFGSLFGQSVLFQAILSKEGVEDQQSLCLEKTHSLVDDQVKRKGRPKSKKNSNFLEKKKNNHSFEGKQKGHWLENENKRYHLFLQVHHGHFIHREMRRLDKIFKSMAKYIGSREAEQCRSHHQKMEKKFGSFSRILNHLRKQHYGNNSVEKLVQDIEEEFQEKHTVLTIQEIQFLEQEKGVKQKIEPVSVEKTDFEENPNQTMFQNILGDDYEHHFNLKFLQ